MSGVEVPPASLDPDSGARADTGLGAFLRACLLVLAVVGIPYVLWSKRGAVMDAPALYASLFAAEPPAGWRIVSAHHLPSGAELLSLVAEARAGAGVGPSELGVLVHSSPGPVLQAFASSGMDPEDWEDGGGIPAPAPAESAPGAQGMQVMGPVQKEIERGDLGFGALSAAFVRLRTSEAGKPYKERMRVNLTSGRRYALLVAGWPEGRDASKRELEELLEKLQLRFEPAPDSKSAQFGR